MWVTSVKECSELLKGNEVENNGSIVNITSHAPEPEQKKIGTDPGTPRVVSDDSEDEICVSRLQKYVNNRPVDSGPDVGGDCMLVILLRLVMIFTVVVYVKRQSCVHSGMCKCYSAKQGSS
jgi:hypothetical protein